MKQKKRKIFLFYFVLLLLLLFFFFLHLYNYMKGFNPIGDEGAEILAEGISSAKSLRHLDLSG